MDNDQSSFGRDLSRSLLTEQWQQSGLPLKWAFSLIGIIAIANIVWVAFTRIELNWGGLVYTLENLFRLAAIYLLVSIPAFSTRVPVFVNRAKTLLFGLVFLEIAWLNMRLLNHLTMTLALPYVDELLLKWDLFFGFNWLWYFDVVYERPWVLYVLDLSYGSLTPFSVAAFCLLVLFGYDRRAFYFVEIFFLTALVCLIVGLFFPAQAAVATLLPSIEIYGQFTDQPGVYHLGHFDRLRAPEGPILIGVLDMPGLVTFPSFHTAAGVLLCVVVWKTWMFVPTLFYIVPMIAATPIYGGHYFIDLISGAIVALLTAWFVAKLRRYSYTNLGAENINVISEP